MDGSLLGEYLFFGVCCGVILAWLAGRFEKKNGITPWGIPSWSWILIGLTGVVPSAILGLIAHKTTKPVAAPVRPEPRAAAPWSQSGPPMANQQFGSAPANAQFGAVVPARPAQVPPRPAVPAPPVATTPINTPERNLPRFAAGPGAVPPPL